MQVMLPANRDPMGLFLEYLAAGFLAFLCAGTRVRWYVFKARSQCSICSTYLPLVRRTRAVHHLRSLREYRYADWAMYLLRKIGGLRDGLYLVCCGRPRSGFARRMIGAQRTQFESLVFEGNPKVSLKRAPSQVNEGLRQWHIGIQVMRA